LRMRASHPIFGGRAAAVNPGRARAVMRVRGATDEANG
jgi:hypothetical protein